MNDRIQEIRERHEGATPGPWIAYEWTCDKGYAVYQNPVDVRKAITGYGSVLQTKENAEFIAHAPDDIAYLLSEVERLQTENDRLMKEAAFWNQAADNQRDNNYLLLKDRAIMKGALEWYGNEENYEEGQLLQDPECGDYYNDPPKVIVDQGRCACTALSHLKG